MRRAIWNNQKVMKSLAKNTCYVKSRRACMGLSSPQVVVPKVWCFSLYLLLFLPFNSLLLFVVVFFSVCLHLLIFSFNSHYACAIASTSSCFFFLFLFSFCFFVFFLQSLFSLSIFFFFCLPGCPAGSSSDRVAGLCLTGRLSCPALGWLPVQDLSGPIRAKHAREALPQRV